MDQVSPRKSNYYWQREIRKATEVHHILQQISDIQPKVWIADHLIKDYTDHQRKFTLGAFNGTTFHQLHLDSKE